VFFESAAALTPQALSGQIDALGEPIPNVYEYRDGMVYLLSDGQDTSMVRYVSGAMLLGYDPTGSNVFFMTSDPLIVQDSDTQRDIYDARVGGGFPNPSLPPDCGVDVCQGSLSPSPPTVTIGGSETQTVQANTPSKVAPQLKAKAKKKRRVKKSKGKRRVKKARKAKRGPAFALRVGR
jgi:hypothetical protein